MSGYLAGEYDDAWNLSVPPPRKWSSIPRLRSLSKVRWERPCLEKSWKSKWKLDPRSVFFVNLFMFFSFIIEVFIRFVFPRGREPVHFCHWCQNLVVVSRLKQTFWKPSTCLHLRFQPVHKYSVGVGLAIVSKFVTMCLNVLFIKTAFISQALSVLHFLTFHYSDCSVICVFDLF